jgi:cytoskeleton protein RodZ
MVDQEGSDAEQEAGRRRLQLRDIRDDVPETGSPAAERVGDKLRAARLKRGEDLAQISESLRIRRTYLEALEDGRHSALPGRPYALGFIRSYAAHLGLDGAAMADAYKQETAPPDETGERPGAAGPQAGNDAFSFPEVIEEARLPRGSLIILFFLLAGAIYGGWYLSISADKMVSERVPPLPSQSGESDAGGSAPAEGDTEIRSFAGDRATAAPMSRSPALQRQTPLDEAAPLETAPLENSAPELAASALEEGAADEAAGEEQIAALTPAPGSETGPSPAQTLDTRAGRPEDYETPEGGEATATPLDGGAIYGAEGAAAGRVIIRALKDAWMRVEDQAGNVLINQTLKSGDVYRTPNIEGLILVARDAGAFEILVDDQSVGYAGPAGLVLTGKSLNPGDLR